MDSSQRPTQILKAAARLIAHYGFDKTTMDDIAREAGVSKGALYLEWSSKDALFDALLGYEMGRLLDDLQARVEADPHGGRISSLYRHTVLALHGNPLIRALYARDGRILGDFVRRQDVSRYTERLMLGADGVRQMQSAGLLRADIRPEVITYLFSIIALGFLSIGTVIPESSAPDAEAVGEVLALMVQGGLETAELPPLAGVQPDNEGKQVFVAMIALMKDQYAGQHASAAALPKDKR